MDLRRPLLEAAFVAALVGASLFAVKSHQAGDAPTLDEPYHLLAGAEYVLDGTYWANIEHPPLAKDLAGFALRGHGALSPRHVPSLDRWPTGRFLPFLYANRLPPDRMVALARRPFPWLLALLIVATYALARGLFGTPAAMLAATLIALDPNFVAHAGVIHTDVAAALTMTATVALAALAMRRSGLLWWLLPGVALGLALATKFSAVLLLPSLALLPFVAEPVPARPGRERARQVARGLSGVALAAATGLLVLLAAYRWNLRSMPSADGVAAIHSFLASRDFSPKASDQVERLALVSPPLGHYVAGLSSVGVLSTQGRGTNFLHGRLSQSSFPEYFFVAFAIKSTPSFLLLTALLVVLGGRKLVSPPVLLLLVPALVYFASAASSSFNIGIRHLLPVYPLLAVAGAGIVSARLSRRSFAVLALSLSAGAAASLALCHPFEMSYFNFFVGGREGGEKWLSDSNTDWGQDLKRLGERLRARGWERDTTVVTIGGLATNYFVRGALLLDPARPIAPGRYAVGATMAAVGGPLVSKIGDPAEGAQIEDLVRQLESRGRRIDRVGSITIWELPPPVAPPAPVPSPGATDKPPTAAS